MTLKNKYDEILNKLEVDQAMRTRILEQVEKKRTKKNYGPIWASLAVAGCVFLLMMMPSQPDDMLPPLTTQSITECSSVEEMQRLVDFRVQDLTQVPFDIQSTSYYVYPDNMAEIQYVGDNQELVFRKMAGSEDISGDYTNYEQFNEIIIDHYRITLKGLSDQYQLALWQDENYTYSLRLENEISESEWVEILKQLTNEE